MMVWMMSVMNSQFSKGRFILLHFLCVFNVWLHLSAAVGAELLGAMYLKWVSDERILKAKAGIATPGLAIEMCLRAVKTTQLIKKSLWLYKKLPYPYKLHQFSSFRPTAGILEASRKWGRLNLLDLLSQHVSAVWCCIIVQLSVEPKLIVVSYVHCPCTQQWALICTGCGTVAQRPQNYLWLYRATEHQEIKKYWLVKKNPA